MDELTIDRVAKRLAHMRLTRRTTVGSGSRVAAIVLAATPTAATVRNVRATSLEP